MSHETAIIEAIAASPLNRGLDGRAWLADSANIPIVMGEDIALFDDEGDDVYQVHFLFASRGRAALASARESFDRMFEDHGAELIFGLVPNFRRDVKLLSRWAGGAFVGKRDTSEGVCELYVLSREMWEKIL